MQPCTQYLLPSENVQSLFSAIFLENTASATSLWHSVALDLMADFLQIERAFKNNNKTTVDLSFVRRGVQAEVPLARSRSAMGTSMPRLQGHRLDTCLSHGQALVGAQGWAHASFGQGLSVFHQRPSWLPCTQSPALISDFVQTRDSLVPMQSAIDTHPCPWDPHFPAEGVWKQRLASSSLGAPLQVASPKPGPQHFISLPPSTPALRKGMCFPYTRSCSTQPSLRSCPPTSRQPDLGEGVRYCSCAQTKGVPRAVQRCLWQSYQLNPDGP